MCAASCAKWDADEDDVCGDEDMGTRVLKVKFKTCDSLSAGSSANLALQWFDYDGEKSLTAFLSDASNGEDLPGADRSKTFRFDIPWAVSRWLDNSYIGVYSFSSNAYCFNYLRVTLDGNAEVMDLTTIEPGGWWSSSKTRDYLWLDKDYKKRDEVYASNKWFFLPAAPLKNVIGGDNREVYFYDVRD